MSTLIIINKLISVSDASTFQMMAVIQRKHFAAGAHENYRLQHFGGAFRWFGAGIIYDGR